LKILVINPVGHNRWDEKDRQFLTKHASPETQVEVVSLPRGPESVETPESHATVIPLVIETAKQKSRDFDAVIVNCFLDPGVDLLKGILKIPVVGPAESSLALATLIGKKTTIITVGKKGIWMIEDRVRQLGYQGKVTSVRGIPEGVLDIDVMTDSVVKHIVEQARDAISNEDTDSIILGCTGLAGLAERIEEEIRIPVIDPAIAALKMAEALVKMKLYNGLFNK